MIAAAIADKVRVTEGEERPGFPVIEKSEPRLLEDVFLLRLLAPVLAQDRIGPGFAQIVGLQVKLRADIVSGQVGGADENLRRLAGLARDHPDRGFEQSLVVPAAVEDDFIFDPVDGHRRGQGRRLQPEGQQNAQGGQPVTERGFTAGVGNHGEKIKTETGGTIRAPAVFCGKASR